MTRIRPGRPNPIAPELGSEHSKIFAAHTTFVQRPLPNLITDGMCAPRQLYEWLQMGHSWQDVFTKLNAAPGDDHIKFKTRMSTRVKRWREDNLIIAYTVQGKHKNNPAVELTKQAIGTHGYSEDQLMFGISGQLIKNQQGVPVEFTPRRDRNGFQTYHAPTQPLPRYPLPQPRSPPREFYDMVDMSTFEEYLQRNPEVYKHYFRAEYDAWLAAWHATGGMGTPPAPPMRILTMKVSTTTTSNIAANPSSVPAGATSSTARTTAYQTKRHREDNEYQTNVEDHDAKTAVTGPDSSNQTIITSANLPIVTSSSVTEVSPPAKRSRYHIEISWNGQLRMLRQAGFDPYAIPYPLSDASSSGRPYAGKTYLQMLKENLREFGVPALNRLPIPGLEPVTTLQ